MNHLILPLLFACAKVGETSVEPEPEPPADGMTFAGAPGGDLQLALVAGYGISGVSAQLTLAVAGQLDAAESAADGAPCPTMTEDDLAGTTTFAAEGCTAPSGDTWGGSATITTAALDLFAKDPVGALTITADALSFANVDGGFTWDGTFDQSSMTVPFHTEMAMTSGFTGPLVGTATGALSVDCVLEGTAEVCTWSGDGSVEGAGTFLVDGQTRYTPEDEVQTGTLTLTGADTIVFDLGPGAAEGCVDYTIEGASGSICL